MDETVAPASLQRGNAVTHARRCRAVRQSALGCEYAPWYVLNSVIATLFWARSLSDVPPVYTLKLRVL